MKRNELRQLLQKIAAIESILSPEWDSRYFSFNSKWGNGEEMGSMRDGSGDEWFVWFAGELCAYKTYSHEEKAIADIESVIKATPFEYSRFINEPAFSIKYSTLIGYFYKENWVSHGSDPLHVLTPQQLFKWNSADYKNWAGEYYELEIDEKFYNLCWNDPANYQIASQLNPELNEEGFSKDLIEIGLL